MDKPNSIESVFKFEGYQVNKIEFHSNDLFQNSEPVGVESNFSIGIDVEEEKNEVRVTLGIELFPNADENNYPFNMNIALTGIFSGENEQSYEELQKLGEINGTAILFPFLRNIVSSVCVNANFPPIMLPVINVYNLIKQQKEAEKT